MRVITCDICGDKIPYNVINVNINDGEHPHSGSTMTKNIDCCHECIRKIPHLHSKVEYLDLVKLVKGDKL